MIPVVDQLCDVRDVVANCIVLSDEEGRRDEGNWFALGLTCFGFIPTIGSAVKTVAKAAVHNGVRLIDIIKRMEWLESLGSKIRLPWGRAPLDWLRRYDWAGAAKAAAAAAKRAFENALRKVEAAIRWAVGATKAKLQRLAETFSIIIARVGQAIAGAAAKVRDAIAALLRRERQEIGRFDATPGAASNQHLQRQSEAPPPPPKATKLQVLREMDAAEANSAHIAAGRNPPYRAGTNVRDVRLLEDATFVRVHGPDNKARSWMMQADAVVGLTPEQIRDKFALPESPTLISDVKVPAGTIVRVGEVAPQPGWGSGGSTQFELLERLTEDRFINTRSL